RRMVDEAYSSHAEVDDLNRRLAVGVEEDTLVQVVESRRERTESRSLEPLGPHRHFEFVRLPDVTHLGGQSQLGPVGCGRLPLEPGPTPLDRRRKCRRQLSSVEL